MLADVTRNVSLAELSWVPDTSIFSQTRPNLVCELIPRYKSVHKVINNDLRKGPFAKNKTHHHLRQIWVMSQSPRFISQCSFRGCPATCSTSTGKSLKEIENETSTLAIPCPKSGWQARSGALGYFLLLLAS